MSSTLVLPSGLPAVELRLHLESTPAQLPAGLISPELEEGRALLKATPGNGAPPAWWGVGRVRRRDVLLALSVGAVSLNTQAVPLMEAAVNAGARGLAVLAPLVSHEALATLLANENNAYFPMGITPIQLLVPAFHAEEVLEAIGAYLGVAPWPGGKAPVQFARVSLLDADANGTRLWTARGERPAQPSLSRRAAAWLSRWSRL